MRMLGPVLVACAMSACASSPAELSLDAAAKQFQAAADKACIYVVPTNVSSAVTIGMDGRKVGRLDAANFLRLDVPPGRHVLYVTPASLLPVMSRDTREDVTLDTQAGRCYFLHTVWVEDVGTWRQYRVHLDSVAEAEGQREVNVRWLILPAK